jgi:transposase
MNLVELVKVTSTEEGADDRCPFCGHKKIGKVKRSFFKCYGCRKEWSIRKDSILEGLKVPLTKFILAVKLFILEVPVNKAYKELELAYNTTHKMDNRIRQCIFKFVSEDDEFLSGEVEMDESYFGGRRKVKRGRGAKGKIPVFGILERERQKGLY